MKNILFYVIAAVMAGTIMHGYMSGKFSWGYTVGGVIGSLFILSWLEDSFLEDRQ